jgi:hypothetical protein
LPEGWTRWAGAPSPFSPFWCAPAKGWTRVCGWGVVVGGSPEGRTPTGREALHAPKRPAKKAVVLGWWWSLAWGVASGGCGNVVIGVGARWLWLSPDFPCRALPRISARAGWGGSALGVTLADVVFLRRAHGRLPTLKVGKRCSARPAVGGAKEDKRLGVLARRSWWVVVEGCQRAPTRHATRKRFVQRAEHQGARRLCRRRALPVRPTAPFSKGWVCPGGR